MFTLRFHSPIWMGYSHVCISLPATAWCLVNFIAFQHLSFFFIFHATRALVRFDFRFVGLQRRKVNDERTSVLKYTTHRCFGAQRTHLDYIIILQVRWYSYIYSRNGLLYRHHRWWWWWRRRRRGQHDENDGLQCRSFAMHNNHIIIFTATRTRYTHPRYTVPQSHTNIQLSVVRCGDGRLQGKCNGQR